jgi:dipeptidyl aminopeptidase/acylaminoacyl peptidase
VNVTAGRAVYKNAERPEASGWGVATLLREIIAMDVKARGGRGRDLTRRMLYLPALMVAAVLMACAVVVLALSEKSEAAFPGKNGRIAYESNGVIYTINPDGSAKTKVTNTSTAGYSVHYSPHGKKITYTDYEGNGTTAEIYTINVGGGHKTKVTNNNRDDQASSYSPDGKRIAYTSFDGHDYEIYTMNVGGEVRPDSPTTTRKTTALSTRPTAKRSRPPTATEKPPRSTRSASTEEVSLKSRRAPPLPTHPTAIRSPTRASTEGKQRSTRSMSVGVEKLGLM